MRDTLETRGSLVRLAFPASLALLAALAGCGYQFRVEGAGPTIGSAAATSSSTSPPPRLVVRTLENKSFEPNLETATPTICAMSFFGQWGSDRSRV
jgi:hypothetical protein